MSFLRVYIQKYGRGVTYKSRNCSKTALLKPTAAWVTNGLFLGAPHTVYRQCGWLKSLLQQLIVTAYSNGSRALMNLVTFRRFLSLGYVIYFLSLKGLKVPSRGNFQFTEHSCTETYYVSQLSTGTEW